MNNKIKTLTFSIGGSLTGVIAEEVSGGHLKQVGTCPTCGRAIKRWQYNNLHVHVKYPTKKWPDLLHNLYVPAFVSDNVLNDLKAAKITCFKTHLVTFEDIPQNKMPTFNYWALEPIYDVEYGVHIFKNDVINETFCSTCKSWEIPKGYAWNYPYPIFYSVTQTPYFFWNAKTMNVYRQACSVEIIKLAIERKWNGCEFHNEEYNVKVNHYEKNWMDLLFTEIQRREAEIQSGVIIKPAG